VVTIYLLLGSQRKYEIVDVFIMNLGYLPHLINDVICKKIEAAQIYQEIKNQQKGMKKERLLIAKRCSVIMSCDAGLNLQKL
jgi:hypothetical protein